MIFGVGETAVALAVTRPELDSTGFGQAATRSLDAGAARRMLALAVVLEGHSRTEAASCAAWIAGRVPRSGSS
ncbi:MAG: hypothetical protein ACREDA_12380, partial [Methylocella sp.]